MHAVLLEVDEQGIEFVVRDSLSKWPRQLALVEFRRGKKWTEVEPFLRDVFLTEPFGDASIGKLKEVSKRKIELAFQATDLVMFLARDFQPKKIYHLTMTHELAVTAAGCVIEYDHDVLLIVHVKWHYNA